MSVDQVLAIARHGASMDCKEALFTLGDRPEGRWTEAAEWLAAHGFASTLEYIGHLAQTVTRETGLLPHLNPGVMSFEELIALRPVAASMGMMLETTSRSLFETPGQVHFGSPDKDPAVRLQVLDDAGRARIPFTTGVLIGIGETLRDRAESLLAIRRAHREHGHIQEVIVQNFRAKPRTAMRGAADAGVREYAAAIATARVVLGPRMRIQVPPNLSDPTELELLLRAGADDWGGVSPLTADHVNPERPWPQISDLESRVAATGFELKERLTVHPEYLAVAPSWIDDLMLPHIVSLAGADGLAAPEPVASHRAPVKRSAAPDRSISSLIDQAAADPTEIGAGEWTELLSVQGAHLDHLVAAADTVRRLTVGEAVSLVANWNLSTDLFGVDRDAGGFNLIDLADVAEDAWDLGATEICAQGRIRPNENPESYLQIVRAIKITVPGIHLHAYGPREIVDLSARTGMSLAQTVTEMRAAGVDTVPGTGTKVLSQRVHGLVGAGDVPVDAWLEALVAAHRAGLRSTSVLHYGHVETASERVAHVQQLRAIQQETGGIIELVLMPHPSATPLVGGRSPLDEHRAMFAVARLMLAGSITHIQVPWTRFDDETVAALLRAGADDLGGTLFDGRVLPQAGAEAGREMLPNRARRIVAPLFRPLRQRSTDYSEVPAGRRIL